MVDATDKGPRPPRLKLFAVLRGKHKTIYTPQPTPATSWSSPMSRQKLVVTGNKADDKNTIAIPAIPAGDRNQLQEDAAALPGRALETAVKGMLPKGSSGLRHVEEAKCYAGSSHPHSAQQPQRRWKSKGF